MATLISAAFVTACGGGGDSAPAVTSVASVTPGVLMYGKTGQFTVTGENLNLGVTLIAPGCAGIAEVAGGGATQRAFTCTPGATGTLPVSVQNSAGATLLAISPVIPQPRVTMKTTLGDIVLELDPAKAPITVGNFLQYVSDNFYNNLVFHRATVNPVYQVIQGGGFDKDMKQVATRAPIKLEVPNGLSNVRGTVAMARTSVPDSATSQFFINTGDNVIFDTNGGGYAVFGKVVTGMATADQIAALPVHVANGLSLANAQVALTDVPVTPPVMLSVTQTQ